MNAQAQYAGDISTGGTLDPLPETLPKIDEAISDAVKIFQLSFVYQACTALSPAYSYTHVEEIDALGYETNTYARTLIKMRAKLIHVHVHVCRVDIHVYSTCTLISICYCMYLVRKRQLQCQEEEARAELG